jgi:hypothetical protein
VGIPVTLHTIPAPNGTNRMGSLKVYLHRPRSQLAYCHIENTSKCAPPPSEKSLEDQQRAYDFYTTKALEAAGAGIGLFTLPTPFVSHTPLLICGLTLCILAHISACRFKLTGTAYTAARDRVRLGLGAIKALGGVSFEPHRRHTGMPSHGRVKFYLLATPLL